jgi:hypothetical protein
MHFYIRVAGAGVTLSVLLLSLIPSALAAPRDEVSAAASTWAQALGEDEPDKVLPLY